MGIDDMPMSVDDVASPDGHRPIHRTVRYQYVLLDSQRRRRELKRRMRDQGALDHKARSITDSISATKRKRMDYVKAQFA
jgi:hypothetical protein